MGGPEGTGIEKAGKGPGWGSGYLLCLAPLEATSLNFLGRRPRSHRNSQYSTSSTVYGRIQEEQYSRNPRGGLSAGGGRGLGPQTRPVLTTVWLTLIQAVRILVMFSSPSVSATLVFLIQHTTIGFTHADQKQKCPKEATEVLSPDQVVSTFAPLRIPWEGFKKASIWPCAQRLPLSGSVGRPGIGIFKFPRIFLTLSLGWEPLF